MKGQATPRLRQARREDADLIVRLIDMSSHGGIGEHYRQLYGDGIDWRGRARLEIAAGGEELGYQNAVIITVGGVDAGGMILNPLKHSFVFISPPDSRIGLVERLIARAPGSLFIRELAIFPSYRGKGLARLLIEFAESFAVSRSIESISLTVNGDNTPAIGLYESMGFREIARSRIERHDVLLMTKAATPSR